MGQINGAWTPIMVIWQQEMASTWTNWQTYMSVVQATNAVFVYIPSVVRSILRFCLLNPDTSDTSMLDTPWDSYFMELKNHQVFYFHTAIIILLNLSFTNKPCGFSLLHIERGPTFESHPVQGHLLWSRWLYPVAPWLRYVAMLK